MSKYLSSSKLELVKFRQEHITDEYLSWLQDPRVTRYLEVSRHPPRTKEDVTLPIEPSSRPSRFALITEGKYIGTLSLGKVSQIDQYGEIGYMIGDPNYWGKGLATEAVRLICEYAFKELGLRKLVAGVVTGNRSSVKVLEKNGFLRNAVDPEHFYLDGKYLDVKRFYLLNPDRSF